MRTPSLTLAAGLCALAAALPLAAAAAPPADVADIGLATSAARSETARSVAADPSDASHWLAALNAQGQCRVRSSADGARTWSRAVALPPDAAGSCFDPVVVYAPDGRRAYALYGGSAEDGLLFSASADQGATWSAPITIVPPPDNLVGGGRAQLFGQRIAVPIQRAHSRFIYVAANAYVGESFFGLIVTRSTDRGASWAPWTLVSQSSTFYAPLNSGTGIAGGRGGNVLLVWDETSEDAPGAGASLKIRAIHSADFGASWSAPFIAAREALASRGSPDVEIGPDGAAHLAYARTRPGGGDPELTDVRYASSAAPPYRAWSRPLTLSGADAVRAANPALAVEDCGSSSVVHVSWTDGRRAAPLHDVFYARKRTVPATPWSTAIRVSNPTPPAVVPLDSWFPSADSLVGLHGLAAAGQSAFALWTDRRDGVAGDTDVFGSRVRSGITCR